MERRVERLAANSSCPVRNGLCPRGRLALAAEVEELPTSAGDVGAGGRCQEPAV